MGYKLGFISTEKTFNSLKSYTTMHDLDAVGYIKPIDFLLNSQIDLNMAAQFANKVDAIVVATEELPEKLIQYFIKQSKHLLILGNIGSTLQHTHEIESLLFESGTTLQIENLERTKPVYTALRQFLKQPQYCRIEKWITQKNISSAALIDEVDMAISCFQSRVADVSCHANSIFNDQVDLLNVKLTFQNGANADILIHGSSKEKMSKGIFVAKNGYYHVDFNTHIIVESAMASSSQIPLLHSQETTQNISQTAKKVLSFDPTNKAFQNFKENMDYGFTPIVSIADIKNIALVLQKAQHIMHRNCVNWA